MARKTNNQQEYTNSYPDLLGKLPPQALEIEEAVLGAALLEKSACTALLSQIQNSEVFYKEHHCMIYQAIQDLRNLSETVDLLTVSNLLRKNGQLEIIGGLFGLTQLTTRVNSGTNIQSHMRILIEKWTARELIKLSSMVHVQAFDAKSDVFEIMESTMTRLLNIQNTLSKKDTRSAEQIIPEVLKQWQEFKDAPTGTIGIPSGITKLDRNTNGFKKTEVTIVAARPGMGKTAFVIQVVNSAISGGHKVGMFSLEMRDTEIVGRLIVRHTGVSKKRLLSTDYSIEDIKSKINGLAAKNFFVDDSSALSVMALKSKASAMKLKFKIDLLVVDYLQLAKGTKGGNREQEISEISRGLKEIAKDLDIPVVALSQLSREVEKRADKRPQLSDLRESGSIEQDADNVLFLYRPEYYMKEMEFMPDGKTEYPTKDMIEIIRAKARDGETGLFIENCHIALNKFFSDEDAVKEISNDVDWANAFDQKTGEVF